MQARVRELQLRLDTRRAADLAAPGAVSQELEQGGLAYPGLAARTRTWLRPPCADAHEAAQSVAFVLPSAQPRPEPAIGHACLTARTPDQASTWRTPAGGEVKVSSVLQRAFAPGKIGDVQLTGW